MIHAKYLKLVSLGFFVLNLGVLGCSSGPDQRKKTGTTKPKADSQSTNTDSADDSKDSDKDSPKGDHPANSEEAVRTGDVDLNTGAAKKAKDVALVTLNLTDPKIEEKIVAALVDGAWKMSPNDLGTTSDIIVFKKHPTNPKYLKALVDGKELDAYPYKGGFVIVSQPHLSFYKITSASSKKFDLQIGGEVKPKSYTLTLQ